MSPKFFIDIATCLPVVYYMAICSLLWLPIVYNDYLSLLWIPVVCYDIVYFGYLKPTMATWRLLWLLVVYYGCTYSLPSVLPSLLYLPGLHYNCLCVAWSALPTGVLSLPMLLSALLTHGCIPCLVYMIIKSAMPK